MQNYYSKTLKPLFISAALAITLSSLQGCSFFTPYKAPITQGTIVNQESLDTLQAGLTMEQVQDLLGPPLGQDPFLPNKWEYVFYTTDSTLKTNIPNHIIVQFDHEQYLEFWEVKNTSVVLNR